MNEQTVAALISAGFSYEDLYKKGILTIKSEAEKKAEEKQDEKPAEKPEEKPAEKPEEKPAEKPEEKPAEKQEEKPAGKPEQDIASVLAEFKRDIISAIHGANLKDSTRTDDDSNQMTVSAALQGLYKGV